MTTETPEYCKIHSRSRNLFRRVCSVKSRISIDADTCSYHHRIERSGTYADHLIFWEEIVSIFVLVDNFKIKANERMSRRRFTYWILHTCIYMMLYHTTHKRYDRRSVLHACYIPILHTTCDGSHLFHVHAPQIEWSYSFISIIGSMIWYIAYLCMRMILYIDKHKYVWYYVDRAQHGI